MRRVPVHSRLVLQFHRDHPQLLDEIKRKSIDPATSPPSPVSSDVQLQILQLQYTEMSTQYQQLQSVLTATVKELVEVKKRQEVQGAMMREMAGYLLEMKRQRVQDTSADALSRQGLQDNAHELQATGAAVSDGMHPKVFGDGRFLSEEEMRILQDKD